jgi:hypothetical protein
MGRKILCAALKPQQTEHRCDPGPECRQGLQPLRGARSGHAPRLRSPSPRWRRLKPPPTTDGRLARDPVRNVGRGFSPCEERAGREHRDEVPQLRRPVRRKRPTLVRNVSPFGSSGIAWDAGIGYDPCPDSVSVAVSVTVSVSEGRVRGSDRGSEPAARSRHGQAESTISRYCRLSRRRREPSQPRRHQDTKKTTKDSLREHLGALVVQPRAGGPRPPAG